MSWKGVLAIIAIIFVAVIAVMGYQALTATKTFNGQLMTFEYPSYLNVTDRRVEAGFEYVFLEDYEGDTILVIAADVPPEVAELVLLNVSEKYGTDLEGPIWRDIGGVRCKHYDDNTLEKCAYIFEKQGMTFVVFADIGANSASEGIIKSIKPK